MLENNWNGYSGESRDTPGLYLLRISPESDDENDAAVISLYLGARHYSVRYVSLVCTCPYPAGLSSVSLVAESRPLSLTIMLLS